MTAAYKYIRERKELFQPKDNIGTRTSGHEVAMNKSRLEIGKVVSNWGNELPPKQEGRIQVSAEDGT